MEPEAPPPPQWTEEQLSLLQEHRVYHQKMLKILQRMEDNPPTGTLPKLPLRPKRLQEIYAINERKKETLEQFNAYLIQHVVEVEQSKTSTAETCGFTDPQSLEDLSAQIRREVENMKRQEARTLSVHLQFGEFLEKCKAWFDRQGGRTMTWAKWLHQHTGYSDVHGRKLRGLASILSPYPQFYKLSLPFTVLYSRRDKLKKLLELPQYQTVWAGSPDLRRTEECQG